MRNLLPLMAVSLAISMPAVAAETVGVPGFRSVELRGGGNVTLRRGPVQRVIITSGSSAYTQFRVVRNGQLKIDACNDRCPRHYNLEILIESPRVPDVAVTGGGNINVAPGFAAQPNLAAAVTGGGRIDTRPVGVSSVSAAVSGGGLIVTNAMSSLHAAVSGGGSIRYTGNPRVSSAVQGGGAVSRVR